MPPKSRLAGCLRVLKWCLYALAGVLCLLILATAASLYFLPDIAGSSRAKGILESRLSDTLNRPFRIQRLAWGWQNGLEIDGVEIADTPAFSDKPIIFISHAGLKIDFSRLIKKQVRFVLLLSKTDLNIIRDTRGRVNIIEAFSSKPKPEKVIPPKKPKTPVKQKEPFELPIDVSATIHLDGISIAYADLDRQKQLDIKNASIRLDAPSLMHDPATLTIDTDLSINGHTLPRSALRARVEHLFDARGALNINNLAFNLDADLPGTRAAVSGDMGKSGISGDVRVDLAKLLNAAVPLIPDLADRINLAGRIGLVTSISGRPNQPINFDARLTGEDIGVSGALLKEKSLDSGNLGLQLNGSFHQKDETLLVRNGNLSFLNNSRVQFSGDIKQVNSDTPFADLSIAPLMIDLDEASHFFRRFLPAQLTIGKPDQKSLLAIDKLKFSGSLPDGPADLLIDDLKLSLPRISLSTDKNSISITGMDLKQLTAEAQGIRRAKKSPFGVQADITLTNALSIKQVRIPGQLDIHGLSQSLSAHASLHQDGSVQGAIDNLGLNLPVTLPGMTAAGKASLTINAKGWLPDTRQIEQLKSWRFSGNLGFLDSLGIEARLTGGSLKLTPKGTPPLVISSISGEPLIGYHLTGKDGIGSLNSRLRINGIKDIPVLHARQPLSADISINASHRFLSSFDLNQRLYITPVGIHEKLDTTIDGIDGILTRKPLPGPVLWLPEMGVTADATVDIPDCRKLKTAGIRGLADMDIGGALSGGMHLRLVPGRSVSSGLTLDLNHVDLKMKNTLTIREVNGDIDLSKTYLIESRPVPDGSKALSSLLSRRIIQPAFSAYPFMPQGGGTLNRRIGRLKEKIRTTPDLSIGRAAFQSLPFPLSIDGTRIMLSLQDGLPNLDYFQSEILGGTVNGSLSLYKKQSDFYLETEINFSGINTLKLFPDAFSGIRGTEAEISGFLYAKIPVKNRLRPLLDDTTVTIAFTRIGSRALERILYALDPHESNEVIVSQRMLLKTGSPRRIRLDVNDGFLSLSGAVSIKSVTIPLPSLQRLNISRMPGIEGFEKNLGILTPIISILKTLSAHRIAINPENGAIGFY